MWYVRYNDLISLVTREAESAKDFESEDVKSIWTRAVTKDSVEMSQPWNNNKNKTFEIIGLASGTLEMRRMYS